MRYLSLLVVLTVVWLVTGCATRKEISDEGTELTKGNHFQAEIEDEDEPIANSAKPVARPMVERQPISVAELNERPVIGELGLALGTVVEIEATVMAGRDLRAKGVTSSYLLKVTRVGDRSLRNALVMEFSVPSFVDVQLAEDTFGLHELKTGKKTGTLNSKQIEKLERGYVGKAVRLAVYEVGRFSGIPSRLPDDVMHWADVGFGFSSSLVVLAERK